VLACPVRSELQSFLVEITSIILSKKDDKAPGYIVDKIVDQTGSKGTGMIVDQTGSKGTGMIVDQTGSKGTGMASVT